MSKRLLITGGSGFVGRTLSRQVYGRVEICVIDTQEFGEDRLSDADRAEARIEKIDIRDIKAVRTLIDDFKPDAIIHLAAVHFIPACEADPSGAASVNIVGTLNLLEACPPGCRFVFASSGAVYAPSELLHDEDDSLIRPSDIYGYTKLHGEQYVRYMAKERKFPAVCVRLFNVVGPGETNPHLLPEIVAQVKAGYQAIRLGNMTPKRDYIHVEDAAAGFAAAALAGEVADGETETVNLGTSHQYSVEEIVALLGQAAGNELRVEQDPLRVRAVDRPFLGAANDRIRIKFGWIPMRTIHDAVADLWRNPDLSRSLRDKYPAASQE